MASLVVFKGGYDPSEVSMTDGERRDVEAMFCIGTSSILSGRSVSAAPFELNEAKNANQVEEV